MKRIVLLMLMVCAMTVCVFAQGYTVQSVTGRVQQEKGSSRVDINVGDTLAADAVIHTGIGASLTLKDKDNKTFTVAAARDGKVSEIATASSGVRINGNVAKTNTGAVSRATAQASTASARANEVIADVDAAADTDTPTEKQ
jgi:hypothetical protein